MPLADPPEPHRHVADADAPLRTPAEEAARQRRGAVTLCCMVLFVCGGALGQWFANGTPAWVVWAGWAGLWAFLVLLFLAIGPRSD